MDEVPKLLFAEGGRSEPRKQGWRGMPPFARAKEMFLSVAMANVLWGRTLSYCSLHLVPRFGDIGEPAIGPVLRRTLERPAATAFSPYDRRHIQGNWLSITANDCTP